MMTLMIAAAVAAAQPAVPPSQQAPHDQHMQMGQSGEHKDMDCCKDCCRDMAAKHEVHGSEHSDHGAH